MAGVLYGFGIPASRPETVSTQPTIINTIPADFPVGNDGWQHYCIWEHSVIVRDLYARRCRLEAEEMTCHAQAVELLLPYVSVGDTLLDAGCGSGYFFHALRRRNIPVEYFGIDAAPSLIEIGRQTLPKYGLSPDRLQVLRFEDLQGAGQYRGVDHIVCINVLSNLDSFHRPLERFLQSARKTVILRESLTPKSTYSYVRDRYLDKGHDLRVHVNAYAQSEVLNFIESFGFRVRLEQDLHTQGKPELTIDYPHYWTFVVAERCDPS